MTDGDRPQLADQRHVETVYQPAEDSRLLAETVIDELSGTELLLDLGTGSGYVAERVRTETEARVVASDITADACERARNRGLPVVRGDLFEAFSAGRFDAVACNPPYLPTPPGMEWDDPMERALSGGPDGRAVVGPVLDGVDRVLAPQGVAYLLVSTLTGLDAIRRRARLNGLELSILAEEPYPFERLLVLRLAQNNNREK